MRARVLKGLKSIGISLIIMLVMYVIRLDARVCADIVVFGYLFYLGLVGDDRERDRAVSLVVGILLWVYYVVLGQTTTMDIMRTGIGLAVVRSSLIYQGIELVILSMLNYHTGERIRALAERSSKGYTGIIVIFVLLLLWVSLMYISGIIGPGLLYGAFDIIFGRVGVSVIIEGALLVIMSKRVCNGESKITDSIGNVVYDVDGVCEYGECSGDSK